MNLSLGITKANEVPLAALAPALTASAGGLAAAPGQVGQVSSSVIDAHLAVQTLIRSYQVRLHSTLTHFYPVGFITLNGVQKLNEVTTYTAQCAKSLILLAK